MAYLIYRYEVQRYRTKWVVMLRNSDGQPSTFRPFYLILGGNAPKYEAGFLAKCWVPMLRNTHLNP